LRDPDPLWYASSPSREKCSFLKHERGFGTPGVGDAYILPVVFIESGANLEVLGLRNPDPQGMKNDFVISFLCAVVTFLAPDPQTPFESS
jgi:hypothetical protein